MSEDRQRRSVRPSPSPAAVASNAAHAEKPKNAAEIQRSQLEKLMKDPSREIKLPGMTQPKRLAPARDIIPNVQGSSAGAGSGEFHVYKQSRRREYERVKMMEEEDAKEKAEREARERQETIRAAEDAKTAKNREKRLKKKAKRDKKGKGKSVAGANAQDGKAQDGEGASSSESSGDEDGAERQKKRKLAQGAPGSVVFRGKDEREQDDDQPREEEIRAKRVEDSLHVHGGDGGTATAPEFQGIRIVDEE